GEIECKAAIGVVIRGGAEQHAIEHVGLAGQGTVVADRLPEFQVIPAGGAARRIDVTKNLQCDRAAPVAAYIGRDLVAATGRYLLHLWGIRLIKPAQSALVEGVEVAGTAVAHD